MRSVMVLLLLLGYTTVTSAEDRVTQFAKGQWDATKWRYVKLPHMPKVNQFEQRDGGLGCGKFDSEDSKKGIDYVLLAGDAGGADGEVAITFMRGPETNSAPGVILSPVYNEQGAIVSGIGIYVASYTMAVWELSTDAKTGETKYKHMVRVTRWFGADKPHVLRCRYRKDRNRLAVQIDDSDPLVFTNLEHPVNSEVVLVGCHGGCEFRSIAMTDKPTIQWEAAGPAPKQ